MLLIKIITSAILCSTAMAAGGSHGSLIDLKFYAINFLLFAGVIIWKVLPLVKNHFREQHLLMQNQFHTASEKLRLAKIEKEKIEKELEGLERKVSEMKNSSERDLDVYRVRYRKELEEKVVTLQNDLDYQLEFETMALNNNMYLNLINKITAEVENKVNDSQSDKTMLAQALIRKSGIN
jgi:F0F1-type ATP synthase membrane subunit b/b'